MAKADTQHQLYMRLALKLARKAEGKTNPNPLVGAVVVKHKRILGRGYHRKAGLAHAEVIALNQAKEQARGAGLYLTLEPCCHYGRTAPCVDKIIASGIKHVVIAMRDPNPLVNGKSIRILKKSGIKITEGVLAEEARAINKIFIKYISKKLPFVTVKAAQSLDGKIATATGEARWISSAASRRLAHQLRQEADAVLIGVNTLLRDNPLLTARLNQGLSPKQPKKIIVDSRLRTHARLKIFSAQSPAEVIIATTKYAAQNKILALTTRAQIIIVKDENGRVSLKDLFKRLAQMGLAHILIEGGGEIIASALEQKLVDRLMIFIAPKIIGGKDAPTAVEGRGVKRLSQAINLSELKLKKVGPDLLLTASV